jgi:signal transduction histidine kinase
MRRTAAIMMLAALAPVAVFAATFGAANLRAQSDRAETEQRARAREINARLDGQIMANQSAMAVLAASPEFMARGAAATRKPVMDVMRNRSDWQNVILTDAVTGQELWDAGGVARRAARPEVAAYLMNVSARRAIGAIGGQDPGCPCIPVHQPVVRDGALRYVLTVSMKVDTIQSTLDGVVRAPDVGAVVDRSGNFIARTLDPRERVGTPASQYVRDAISGGASGAYQGVTLEGFINRSVFETSSLSGFSTHVAMPRTKFSLLGVGSLGLQMLAIALSLAVAAGGGWYVAREERRRRVQQRQQSQAQRLEAIGRFASSVAHDFNALLTIMTISLRRLNKRITDPDDRIMLEHADDAANRGAALVSQLMSFVREKRADPDCIDLVGIVTASGGLMRQALGDTISFVVHAPREQLNVLTDKAQLEAALLNLVTNARDAMPLGGELGLTLRRSAQKGFAELVVRDTGHGMPADVAERALDPFFTTKAAGKGTGLGLAQVHGLMLQSGGRLELQSSVGAGTRVTLVFQTC